MEIKPISSYLAEFVGTFLLVLIGCGAAVLSGAEIGYLGVALAFGIALMLLVYVIGPISGCHVNPGVTLGLAIGGKFPIHHVAPYIIVQLAGALVGAWVLYLIASGKVGFDVTHAFATNGYGDYSPQKYGLHAAALVECLISAILIFAVLSTTHEKFPIGFNGLVIGSALGVVHLIGIPVTNASANFARSFGVAVFQGGVVFEQLWLFAATQVVGAIVAVIVYKIIRCGKC